MRQESIHAAILGQLGNHDQDDSYPRPLTCDVCGFRPQMAAYCTRSDGSSALHTWYVTESDPLPEGWQVIVSDVPPARMTFCESCYRDRAEGKEMEYDY